MFKEWLAKQQAKAALLKVFKDGNIGINYSYGQSKGIVYPKIRSVRIDHESKAVHLAFSLPTGLDPKEIKKKEYCFKQVFGQRILIKGDIKEFKLTVYLSSLPKKVPYDYSEISEAIKKEKYFMPIVAGKDSNGVLRIYDATNNPNLLIFGEPGSGKSSILHVILTTLIQYYPPDQLQMVLADFKQSELNLYEGVNHVQSVSYQVREFAPVLKRLKNELIQRGTLLKEHRVRHVNKLPKASKPPYIVLCVDEFVMINDNDIMADLLQIASLGRAYGIYLILSMQRPSHKILSTDVRGVLSVRMGFRTVDLRNALIGETPGSDKISTDEPGTFLLKLDELTEIKAPYLTEDDVENILNSHKSPNEKESHTTPLNASDDNIDIFEVLDE